ncbi:hypothetical protein BESB_067900 [Besnoitia besnoiti]|uniref:Uncharacterized protein n=1 Tax=Besnoitia besnoiti TaxID=94643 RepID=A0A2A9MGN6_BESBE|nr:hypothetical protein BESB_067900 [Besnoitia besnoiti]PFH34757.1 hypothetical protein BESB_067900 [Besnoitia besnoiti]
METHVFSTGDRWRRPRIAGALVKAPRRASCKRVSLFCLFTFLSPVGLLLCARAPHHLCLATLSIRLVGAETMLAEVVRRAKDLVGQQWRNGSRQIAERFDVSHSYLKSVLPQHDAVGLENYKMIADRYAELTEETRASVGARHFEEISKRNGHYQQILLE